MKKEKPLKLYKILVDGKSCHGGSHTWDLPNGKKAGKWQAVAGALALCSTGFHLTDAKGLPQWWTDGAKIYEVEVDGDIVGDINEGDRKVCVQRVRLLREIASLDEDGVKVCTTGEHEVRDGWCVAYGSATVRAYDTATVRAYDTATVSAYDTATVSAYGSATVRAYGSATVSAYGSATVRAYGSATVRAYDTATVRAYGSATVSAYDTATVSAYDTATVRAYDTATVSAYGSATVRAYGSATVSAYDTATVSAYDTATVASHPCSVPGCTTCNANVKVTVEGRSVWVDQRGASPRLVTANPSAVEAAQ